MSLYQPLQPPKIENRILNSDYNYQEFPPSEDLKKYISCYWTMDYHPSEVRKLHRIIPDACVDIIFNLNSNSVAEAAFLTGLMTEFEIVNLTNSYSLLGIRIFADTAHHFLKHPIAEWSTRHVMLEDIYGDAILSTIEEIVTISSRSKMMEKIENELRKWLRYNKQKVNHLLNISIQYMYEYQGNLSISSLAKKINYSERSIRRTFQELLGVCPKEFINIIRFQNTLRGLYTNPTKRLTDLASTYGYYDQSHFIHHFKRYYGKLPTQISS
ncbi:AraC family transcriptional regulator [Shimazuella kribbensis]|uniref:AraC family transcriptional regulator n=1 Tax=Shimazuella kribbensis TaxID=139808 RepID=UPI000412CBD5|nr:helix-turn-helix domain-containing protein [Shimazuella kribbensis]